MIVLPWQMLVEVSDSEAVGVTLAPITTLVPTDPPPAPEQEYPTFT
jgi:hypothetical protein